MGVFVDYPSAGENVLQMDNLILILILFEFGIFLKAFEDSRGIEEIEKFFLATLDRAKQLRAIGWVVGVLLFIDDYLSAMLMGKVYKRLHKPFAMEKEELAHLTILTANAPSLLFPFTTWGILICITLNIGASDYFKMLGYTYYPFLVLIWLWLTIFFHKNNGGKEATLQNKGMKSGSNNASVSRKSQASDPLKNSYEDMLWPREFVPCYSGRRILLSCVVPMVLLLIPVGLVYIDSLKLWFTFEFTWILNTEGESARISISPELIGLFFGLLIGILYYSFYECLLALFPKDSPENNKVRKISDLHKDLKNAVREHLEEVEKDNKLEKFWDYQALLNLKKRLGFAYNLVPWKHYRFQGRCLFMEKRAWASLLDRLEVVFEEKIFKTFILGGSTDFLMSP